ncbi:hypothetical protein D3C76_1161910 [compost metagenome]
MVYDVPERERVGRWALAGSRTAVHIHRKVHTISRAFRLSLGTAGKSERPGSARTECLDPGIVELAGHSLGSVER